MSSKILILAYFFPPYGGGFSIRVGKFAKYLPQFGWDPVVVSADPASYSDNVSKTGGEIALTPVWRTSSLEKLLGRSGSGLGEKASYDAISYKHRILQKLKHFLLIPDRQILWLPYAVAQSLKLYREFRFRAILATAPPMSTILSALFLGRVLRLPVILDLRDDWSGTATFIALPGFRRQVESWLERLAISRTQYLVVPTNRSYARYSSLFELPAKRVGLIPNGFDPQDFENLLGPPPTPRRDGCLCLMHLGNLPPSRSPISLLVALQRLAEEAPDIYRKVCFVQVGSIDETFAPFLEPLVATGGARVIQPVPHSEAIALMSSADTLVLIPSQETPTAIPGKVYEYMAARRPIMALVEPGATQDLLEQARARWLANVHDVEAIINLVKALVAASENTTGIPTRISEMFLRRFDRREQAKNLALILSEVTKDRPA